MATRDLQPHDAHAPRGARRSVTLPEAVLALALVVFAWTALLGTRTIALPSLEPTISVEDWVAGGAAALLILLLLLVAHAATRNRVAAQQLEQAAALPEVEPRSVDEIVVTAEQWNGLRVLEYSRPPKSEHPAGVYAKVHVAVDKGYVLRVEDLVADAP